MAETDRDRTSAQDFVRGVYRAIDMVYMRSRHQGKSLGFKQLLDRAKEVDLDELLETVQSDKEHQE
jgi:hypothetical protein